MKSDDLEYDQQSDNGADMCWPMLFIVAVGTYAVVLWHEVRESIRRLAR